MQRLTDKDWQEKGNAHSEVYQRLAVLEDGIERGELIYVGELREAIKKRIAYYEAQKINADNEMKYLCGLLDEMGRNVVK